MAKVPKILNYKNLSYEKYEFGQPFKQPNGIYQATCSYRLSKNETLPFYFETPKLKTVSGIVKLDSKYYMDLELPQSGDASSFYNYLLKTDDHNITICHQNSKDWFNQYMPLDVVESFYKSPVILRPNGQLPVMRVRLPSYKGNILTEIYNIKKEKVNDVLCIAEDDYIVGIMEFTGLAFMSQSFYPVYELQKIKIFKENEHRVLPTGYIFSDFNEKVELDKITTSVEEERILKEPTKLETKPAPVANIITPAPATLAISSNLSNPVSSIESKSANTSVSTKTTTILNENIEKILKIKEPAPVAIISNISPTNLSPSNVSITNVKKDEKQEPSLFDIVKNNTLKNALIDDDIFMQHSLGIKTAYQQREANLRKYLQKKNKQDTITILSNTSSNSNDKSSDVETPDINSSSELKSYQETSLAENLQENNCTDNKISTSVYIQDKPKVENLSETHSNHANVDEATLEISDFQNEPENINDNYDNDDNDENDDDSDDGIDYKILDDLEVVVFED